MTRRFSTLNAALKYLRTGDGEDAPIPDAPAGTPLRLYQDWKAGKRQVNYTRESSSNPGNLDEARIKPFGLPSADTTLVLVDISRRSSGKMQEAGLSPADLNIATTGEANRIYNFTPARAIVNVGAAAGGDGIVTTSKITGKKYKKKASDSFTFPFGRGAGEDAAYVKAKSEILGKVSEGTTNRSVSFKPEVYR
jgi:hypothetical protein